MKSLLPAALAIAAIIALTSVPFARATTVGEAAPPLKISTWVKGKPVDLAAAKGKQVIVVEFWATWCPPCRTSIPHLTELQKKYKDVVIVGITSEDVETVKPFVKQMGAQMDYTVAVDDEGKTTTAYMKEYGEQFPIPHALIVNKQGIVAWSGSPFEMDEPLEKIVAGKFDIEAAKVTAARAQKMNSAKQKFNQFVNSVAGGADDATLDKMGKELEALDAELGGFKPGEKFSAADLRKQVRFEMARRQYLEALSAGRPDDTLVGLEKQLEEFAPKDFKLDDYKDVMTVGKTFEQYYLAITGRGDTNALPQLTKKLAATKIKSARNLDEWAWTILTDEKVKIRDAELASKLAKAAVDASEGKEPSPLETYARALFDTGKTGEAVDALQKAIQVAKNDEQRQALGDKVKEYQSKAAAAK